MRRNIAMISQLPLVLGTLVVLFHCERSIHHHAAGIDIQPFVGHPCVRFRNGKFEISPFQLRFGRLGVPTATRNDMLGSRVEMNQDGTGDRMRAAGTLGIRITKKDALEALSLKMIQAKISLEEESRQPFITRKHMSRVRKADPEMTGGNRQIVDGSEASPSHEGFFTRV